MYTATSKDKSFEITYDDGTCTKGTIDGLPFELDMITTGENSLHLILDKKSYIIDIVESDYRQKHFVFKIKGSKYEVKVQDKIDKLLDQLGMSVGNTQSVKEVKAPMPGLVIELLVEPGTEVAEGDKLLVLEAMKMENNITAPAAGVVQSFMCKKGDAVEKGQVLVVFE